MFKNISLGIFFSVLMVLSLPSQALNVYQGNLSNHSSYAQENIADNDAAFSSMNAASAGDDPIRLSVFTPGLFIGKMGGILNLKLTPSFALGVEGRTWQYSGSSPSCSFLVLFFPFSCSTNYYNGYYRQYGIDAEFATSGNLNSDGWIINPRITHVLYSYYSGSDPNTTGPTESGQEYGVYFMYQWFWRSGIFMQLGAGPVYVTNPNINIFSNNNETIDWDFTLGYAF